MNKVLVLVDVPNIYFTLRKNLDGRLDYTKFLNRLQESFIIHRAIAYGGQLSDEAESFISVLQSVGYETRFKPVQVFSDGSKRANFDLDIAMDAVRILPSVDIVVLVSGDGDFVPVIEYIQSRGKRCFVWGSKISKELRSIANEAFEITPEYLIS